MWLHAQGVTVPEGGSLQMKACMHNPCLLYGLLLTRLSLRQLQS